MAELGGWVEAIYSNEVRGEIRDVGVVSCGGYDILYMPRRVR